MIKNKKLDRMLYYWSVPLIVERAIEELNYYKMLDSEGNTIVIPTDSIKYGIISRIIKVIAKEKIYDEAIDSLEMVYDFKNGVPTIERAMDSLYKLFDL